MTQEVQVNLTLWLEVDTNESKKDIEEYIARLLAPTSNCIKQEIGHLLPIYKENYEIHSIKEEAEIYKNS